MRKGRTRRWQIASIVLALVFVVAVRTAVRSSSSGSFASEGVLFHRPGVSTDGYGSWFSAVLAGEEVPAGFLFLRFVDHEGSLGWTGKREFHFELEVCPGELDGVTIQCDGSIEQRLEAPDGCRSLPIRIQVPFWGTHAYRMEMRTVQGDLIAYEFRLAGTLGGDLQSLWRLWSL